MAEPRNPSERNKIGSRKKKGSWLDSVVDALGGAAADVGSFAKGVGQAGLSNIDRVGDVGGSFVKGALYDPVKWAYDNPIEVAETLVNPKRMADWGVDNLLAGKEVERMLRGKGSNMDAVMAAMAMLPVGGGVVDDATRAAFSGGLKSSAKRNSFDETVQAVNRLQQLRQEVAAALGKDIPVIPNEPFGALDKGIIRQARGAANVASAKEGALVDPISGVINRTAEEVGGSLTSPVGIDAINNRAVFASAPRTAADSFEADLFRQAIEADKSLLGKGRKQVPTSEKGLAKSTAYNEIRMQNVYGPLEELASLINQLPKTSAERRGLVQLYRDNVEELDRLQKVFLKNKSKYSKPKD
jgi:hypothetical protein